MYPRKQHFLKLTFTCPLQSHQPGQCVSDWQIQISTNHSYDHGYQMSEKWPSKKCEGKHQKVNANATNCCSKYCNNKVLMEWPCALGWSVRAILPLLTSKNNIGPLQSNQPGRWVRLNWVNSSRSLPTTPAITYQWNDHQRSVKVILTCSKHQSLWCIWLFYPCGCW